MAQTVIILGAAGRDFHNFNLCFRDDPAYRVIAFTAAQIPDVAGRRYPPELAGPAYPAGIPIVAETELDDLLHREGADLAVFSYSDLAYSEVLHLAARTNAAGAAFWLLAPRQTMLKSRRPVIAVTAVRTGCGKSPTTRHVCALLQAAGRRPVVVRHPMPYGDLSRQVLQRFATAADFARHQLTIEEREEYEPLVEAGITVFAGVDYRCILAAAEAEAEVIVWDGGNNDTPFFVPDLHLVLLDPLRPGDETGYWPGETNLRLADIAIIGKFDSAPEGTVAQLRAAITACNPRAAQVLAESAVSVAEPERIRGRKVLVIEDGPTLTHGGLPHGAGFLAARRHGAAAIVDPRGCSVGALAEVYRNYPHIGPVLPAIGYSPQQLADLAATIERCDSELVLMATPARLARLLACRVPILRVSYAYRDHGEPTLAALLRERLPQLFAGGKEPQ